jgi:dienelactone hydrolase
MGSSGDRSLTFVDKSLSFGTNLYPGAEHGFFTKGRPAFNAEAEAAATAHIERLHSRLN